LGQASGAALVSYCPSANDVGVALFLEKPLYVSGRNRVVPFAGWYPSPRATLDMLWRAGGGKESFSRIVGFPNVHP